MKYSETFKLSMVVIGFAITGFSVYFEALRNMFLKDIEELLDTKRVYEYDYFIESVRSDCCVVIERDCNYKVFNHLFNDTNVLFLYIGKNKQIEYKAHFTKPEVMHYIFSPNIELPEKSIQLHYEYNFAYALNDHLVEIYIIILNKVFNSGYFSIKRDELEYTMEKSQNYVLYDFALVDLGRYIITKYNTDNYIIHELETIMGNLKSFRQTAKNIMVWSTQATEDLINFLIRCKILVQAVDLEEFPDFVPLIFPYPFLYAKNLWFLRYNFCTIGFDFRNVKGSYFENFLI